MRAAGVWRDDGEAKTPFECNNELIVCELGGGGLDSITEPFAITCASGTAEAGTVSVRGGEQKSAEEMFLIGS